MGVVSVGNSEKGAEAEAEGGGGRWNVVFNEVCVEGAGGAGAAESTEADAVERGGEVAVWIEEESSDESVGYVEEEGLGVSLGFKVEVAERWSTVGVTDARGEGETVVGSGFAGGECGSGKGWIRDDL